MDLTDYFLTTNSTNITIFFSQQITHITQIVKSVKSVQSDVKKLKTTVRIEIKVNINSKNWLYQL